MRTRRSLQIAVAAVVALLAAGTTFAWAGVLVGGHRADRIGTFEPAAHHLTPVGSPDSSGSTATSRTKPTTTTSPATTAVPASTGRRHSDDPTSPTTDDNGRSNDD